MRNSVSIPASGKQIGPDEIAACVDAALDGWLTAGRFAEQLERDLAKRACPPKPPPPPRLRRTSRRRRVGTRWARLVNSGSSANLLAVHALAQPEHGARPACRVAGHRGAGRRLQPGDEVLTVAAAFPTTVAPILQAGAVPVFVDVRPDTANVDVELLAEAITPKTRAIILARDHDLWLVEDCCDALGAATPA